MQNGGLRQSYHTLRHSHFISPSGWLSSIGQTCALMACCDDFDVWPSGIDQSWANSFPRQAGGGRALPGPARADLLSWPACGDMAAPGQPGHSRLRRVRRARRLSAPRSQHTRRRAWHGAAARRPARFGGGMRQFCLWCSGVSWP